MSDLIPPDEPLDDAARARIRARIRAQVLEGGTAPGRPSTVVRRWLVPVAAAVAVGAVVGGVVLLGGGDDGQDSGPAAPGLATGPASGVSTDATEDPTESPTEDPVEDPAEDPTEPSEVGTSVPVDPELPCTRELRQILPGAAPVAVAQDDTGSTTFYVADGRYTLCDTHDAKVTVHHPKPLVGGGTRNPYELSTEFPTGGTQALMVAGGPVPSGRPDFAVTYTFPDGHVESSITVGGPGDDLWWLVVYRAPDAGAATDGPPSVEVRGGSPAEPLTLVDICAQANHGC